MTDWNVSFKVTGNFSAKVQASSEDYAKLAALTLFISACAKVNTDPNVVLHIDAEPGTVDKPALLELAMRKAGVPAIDWRAVEELLDIIEGEFPNAVEKDALAVVRSSVIMTSQYPENPRLAALLAKVRNKMSMNRTPA